MGVIKNRKSFQDPVSIVNEDPLSDLIESGDDARLAQELSELGQATRRRRKTRRSQPLLSSCDVEGLSSRLVGHKSQRKQRRIQNDKQLRATLASDGDLDEISIYDFVQDTVSVFTLMLEEKDNIALWEAMLAAEPDDVYHERYHRDKRNGNGRSASVNGYSPEDCYSRLDGDMKRTLRRHRCPTDLLRRIENDLESFFDSSPADVYKTYMDNSFSRLLLHATCEYMNLRSRSFDHMGTRWTLVKNPHAEFKCPLIPLSKYLECRRRSKRR
ncbi:R3H domain-containing protein 4 [Galendromus occidentalis]|uniref:R3H domain-containing protein 4 n=1 Tax=Galendromus occidentalis TaxID=34638 RepID=A0AAJ6QQV4_9ACAR|nr:R3H domain-containing protein 4 [Galendromus occidentalis]